MKYFSSLVFILLFSHSAIAQQAVSISHDILKVYKLHQESSGIPPVPALFIYDTQTQQIITPQQVLNIFSRDKTLTTTAIEGITVLSKKTSTKKISQAELKQASKLIKMDTRYIAFFHNLGEEMLAMNPHFPELLVTEKAILKHLSAQADVALYTLI